MTKNDIRCRHTISNSCKLVPPSLFCLVPPDRQLLTEEEHQRFLDLRLSIAESRQKDSFHCQTANCQGWCVYADEVNEFPCDLCKETNCILCKASAQPVPFRSWCWGLVVPLLVSFIRA